ncbi:MAG: cytosine deaminase [Hoeflea sp.]|uniref:amidohydrolase family protein n=1 Tax=Hoeflea sp. TaxID=1940281 RepID=UPI000C0FD1BC|nr:amidohydrolase family protein [Hoeflea sp.]PHR17112.1 MAG: cytosine deaminase [Hoeflea sp.]
MGFADIPHPDFILSAAHILTGADASGAIHVIDDGAVLIKDGVIVAVGTVGDLTLDNPELEVRGGQDIVAMPGFTNSHHHFGLTPLMMGVPFAALELWLPQFRKMRQMNLRLDTLYSAIEMLESGTTTVQHINSGLSGPVENWDRATDEIVSAYGEIGMRSGYCFMIRDQNILSYEDDAKVLAALPEEVRNWLAPSMQAAQTPTRDYMDFFSRQHRKWSKRSPDMVRMNLAPANLHWCSDASLEMIFATARSHGASIHMHLLETERQARYARSRFECSAVEHLDRLGCLGPELTIGHGNWLTRDDLDRLSDCGCMVCHNASSGLRLGSGIAPVNEMQRRNIPVALGIDQSNICDDRDMTIEMKLVWALHRETGMWNDRLEASRVLTMATEHGAKSVGFGKITGRLEIGRQADIVLMSKSEIGRPVLDPRTPIADAVLHRGSKSAIRQVYVGGRLVVDNGRVITIDRDAVLAEIADILSAPMTEVERKADRMVATMMSALTAFHRTHSPDEGYAPYRYNAMNDAGRS